MPNVLNCNSATRILMFHRLMDDMSTAFGLPSSYRIRGTSVTLSEFRVVLRLVGEVLPLAEIETALREGRTPPRGAVLSFDDGYREHLDQIAPLLAEFGGTGVFYVMGGIHGESSRCAVVDVWYWLLDNAQQRYAQIATASGETLRGRVDTLDGKREWVLGDPKKALLTASSAQQQQMLRELSESLGCQAPSQLARMLYLKPSEWTGLSDLGMRVGAHSMTHARLSTIDAKSSGTEIVESVAAITPSPFGTPFSYPDGDWNLGILRKTRAAGASSAVTCDARPVQAGDSAWAIPRFNVTSELIRSEANGCRRPHTF